MENFEWPFLLSLLCVGLYSDSFACLKTCTLKYHTNKSISILSSSLKDTLNIWYCLFLSVTSDPSKEGADTKARNYFIQHAKFIIWSIASSFPVLLLKYPMIWDTNLQQIDMNCPSNLFVPGSPNTLPRYELSHIFLQSL